ncbi:MAG: succinylglutamate desuccinylase/aspartoacylase family protein [Sedimentisphaerales bacterium]|nr:succinylglutamate desuccinylase/aspartoacylase family protein [Sedimentisphaerales bacterium]
MKNKSRKVLMPRLLYSASFILISSFALLASCQTIFTTDSSAENNLTTQTIGQIAPATNQATPYYIIDSHRTGPTVFIAGGIHGNEPSGTYAADQIRHWPITHGKLIVIPRTNILALNAQNRNTPDMPDALRNLNRNFPMANESKNAARSELAKSLWNFVTQHKPDWVIDLHEGSDFCITHTESVGSSIITFPNDQTKQIAGQMIDDVNDTISDPNRRFVLLEMPIDGSLARAAGEHGGAQSMIIETTYKEQPLALRVRQHRIMLNRLLKFLKMTDCPVDTMTPMSILPKKNQITDSSNIFVAVYNGPGTWQKQFNLVARALAGNKNIITHPIGPHEIQTGILSQYNVVIFPGGTGSGQANGIGKDGRANVRKFVSNGGGYIGICAGAYLAAYNYSWSLKIINVTTIDTKHWRRGTGIVQIELTESGRKIIEDHPGLIDIYYANGPLLGPANADDLPEADVLAYYRSDMAINVPGGVMPNSPAIVAAPFERGRVICLSAHAESPSSKNLQHFITQATLWVNGSIPEKPISQSN